MRESPFQPEPVLGGNPVSVYKGPRTGIDAVDKVLAGIASDPFGGVNAHPVAGAVTAKGVIDAITRSGRGGIGPWISAILSEPEVMQQANRAWRNVGFSGKVVKPEVIGQGVDAVALKVAPYSRGGEILKLFGHALEDSGTTTPATTRQVIEKAPKDLLLKHRLAGNLTFDPAGGSFGQMGYATQPIAETAREYPHARMIELWQNLKKIAEEQGWALEDMHKGNFGTFRGRPTVIDEGSVVPKDMQSFLGRMGNRFGPPSNPQ